MAKKRKQKDEEKEKAAFSPPEFDEKEFMENEIKNSKIAVFVFLYAIFFAIISLVLTWMGQVRLALFLGLLGLVTMANVFDKAGLDILHLSGKDWLGNYVMFIFSWLGVWIIICNPPFSDMAHPDVDALVILSDPWNPANGTWNTTAYGLEIGPKEFVPYWNDYSYLDESSGEWERRLYTNETFNITMRVSDNVGVESVRLHISLPNGSVDEPALLHHDSYWMIDLTYPLMGDYLLEVRVKDVNGNEYTLDRDWDGKDIKFILWPEEQA